MKLVPLSPTSAAFVCWLMYALSAAQCRLYSCRVARLQCAAQLAELQCLACMWWS